MFRVVFGGGYPGTCCWTCPQVPLPDWVLGVTLLGPVTREALLAGLYDGLRLATIVICVGAANSLANPKRLLALDAAGALRGRHRAGRGGDGATAVRRQRPPGAGRPGAARRARPAGSRRLRRFLVPVLEDALERSLALAAGMDTRGYGRSGGATSAAQRRTTGALMLAGLVGLCVGVYAVLDHTAPRVLAGPMLASGALVAVGGLRRAGRRVQRTRYRPDRWRWPELAVVGLRGRRGRRRVVGQPAPAGDRLPRPVPASPASALRRTRRGGRWRRSRSPRRRRRRHAGAAAQEVPHDRAARHPLRLRRRRPVLAGVDLTIEEGELVAGLRARPASASRRCSAW